MSEGGHPESANGEPVEPIHQPAHQPPVNQPMYQPVYKVVRLVASSAVSWEEAARNGVAEASKTIIDLRSARVSDMDTLVSDGAVVAYRLKLELSFQVNRTAAANAGHGRTEGVKRYLVVANKTLAGDIVPALVAERMSIGPAEFHILVPATRSRETQRLLSGASDPLSGYTVVAPNDLAAARAIDRQQAGERLATFIQRLETLDTSIGQQGESAPVVTSEVGGHDPLRAISAVLERSSFDEIILSTLPSSVSRWLRMDLPSQLRRSFSIPVVVVNPPSD